MPWWCGMPQRHSTSSGPPKNSSCGKSFPNSAAGFRGFLRRTVRSKQLATDAESTVERSRWRCCTVRRRCQSGQLASPDWIHSWRQMNPQLDRLDDVPAVAATGEIQLATMNPQLCWPIECKILSQEVTQSVIGKGRKLPTPDIDWNSTWTPWCVKRRRQLNSSVEGHRK